MSDEEEAVEEDADEADSGYPASKRVPRVDDDPDPDNWLAFLDEPPRVVSPSDDEILF